MKRGLLFAAAVFVFLGACSTSVSVQTAPSPAVPKFSHVLVIVLENKDYGEVVGNPKAPHINALAKNYALLTDFYSIRHPSLPNYIAMIGGDTFGIAEDCTDCFVNAKSLPDLLEAAGRTWKTYQEGLPSAGFTGTSSGLYVIRHNPFLYFDPIRKDAERLRRSVVPLPELDRDLSEGRLPDYAFIMPDLCHSSHDCGLDAADRWLEEWTKKILAAPAFDRNSLLVVTFDEGSEPLDPSARANGGRIATILVSPLVVPGFRDATRYTHYSVLKTIAEAWGLEKLRRAADPGTKTIIAPWR